MGKPLLKEDEVPSGGIADFIMTSDEIKQIEALEAREQFGDSGIANFGRRPTFGGKKVLLEVHIFDFQKEIYGAELTVEFINFIREEIKFDNLDQLKNQVETDKEKAKSFLKYNK